MTTVIRRGLHRGIREAAGELDPLGRFLAAAVLEAVAGTVEARAQRRRSRQASTVEAGAQAVLREMKRKDHPPE